MTLMIRCGAGAIALACILVVAGCATPVGVNKVSPRKAYQLEYTNPLGAGVLGDQARFVLNRYNLLQKFDKEPAAAIAELHQKALHDNRGDILYALAEVCYLYGGQLADSYDSEKQAAAPDYFLLSTLYSFYFVSEERSRKSLNIFDHRSRNAVDMFNYGLWQGLATGEEGELVLKSQLRKLPFGQITISLDTAHFPWDMAEFASFEPADKYAVRGITVRNRTAGIGLPLIAIKKASNNEFSSGQAVPATAALRIQGDLAALAAGTATADLVLYSTQDVSSVTDLHNNAIPLESDLTTPLAYKLEGSEFFDLGLSGFLGREPNKIPDGLYLQEPYRPGKIPVIFVHGTASNPVWWVEMFNTLRFDPLIRQNYQFWYFVYTSNKAVAFSAAELREALKAKVTALDPQAKDPALQQMVVVGHSQGGLLTKFTAVDTGEKLVEAVTGKSLDLLDMSAENKAKVKYLLVVKPLPFVKTVVFMSTPHRGSFQSKAWNRDLVRALIKLPAKIVQTSMDMFDYMTDDVKRVLGGRVTLTSADSMSPENPVLTTLADIPLAPGVKGHSIIAVKGDDDPKLGNDGVVEYTSAHLDGMASELIVKSDHSSQLNPLAIDEVRRILVEQLPDSEREIEKQK